MTLAPRQILTPDGVLADEAPLGIDDVRRLYRAMVAARLYDRKGVALQRQGRLATYPPFEGGYPLNLLLLQRMGDERGGSPPEGVCVLPPSITVGAHMVHAVGLGWAAKLRGEDRIAITYFGDGATSEGDFHEAMNRREIGQSPKTVRHSRQSDARMTRARRT